MHCPKESGVMRMRAPRPTGPPAARGFFTLGDVAAQLAGDCSDFRSTRHCPPMLIFVTSQDILQGSSGLGGQTNNVWDATVSFPQRAAPQPHEKALVSARLGHRFDHWLASVKWPMHCTAVTGFACTSEVGPVC